MISTGRRYCREAFGTYFEIDYSKIGLVVSLKVFIQMVIGSILLLQYPNKLVPFLLGTLIIGIGDSGGTLQDKFQGLGVGFFAMVSSALFGAISYIYPASMIPIAFAISFITSIPLGMNMFIFGIITTTFTPVYLGLKPDNISDPVVWTAVAGAIVIFQCILSDLCGMYEGVRNSLYRSYGNLGRVISTLPFAQFAEEYWEISDIHQQIPSSATRNVVASFGKDRYKLSSYSDATRKKFQILVKATDFLRCAFVYLLIQEKKASCDEVLKLQQSVGSLCICIGQSCQYSWLIYIPSFKRRMKTALDKVEVDASEAMSALAEKGLDVQGEIIKIVLATLQDVTNAMEEPWKRESIPNVFKELAELASLPTYSPNRALWIYCVRFSIVYTLASVPMLYQDPAYSHWLPMSIAIISMPGVGSTLKKVFVRTIGTIIGLLLGALSMYLIQITLPNMAMFVVLFSLFGFFACLFYHAR